ncbi:MAG TPA: hypothetical protein VEJ41_02540 [Candidatus Acidoferrales bacterium]|nr:hypothetical protein [Candidatus Acidoferrales bacterium]
MISSPLRYGVIADRDRVFAWESRCVRRLQESGLAALDFVACEDPASGAEPAVNDIISELAGEVATHFPLVALDELADREVLRLDARGIAAKTQELALDFLLVFGTPEARFEAGRATRAGAWAFVSSDPSSFSSPMPCFWEIYHDEPVTGAALLRLTDPSALGLPLQRGFFPVAHDSLRQSIEAVFTFLPEWPVDACKRVLENGPDAFLQPNLPTPARVLGLPSKTEIQKLHSIEARARRALQRERKHYLIEWNIGIMDAPASAFIGRDERAIVKLLLPSRKRRYVADPCVVTVRDQQYVFCEEYPYDTGQGFIACFEIQNRHGSNLARAIQSEGHLSYPQVFEHDGALYCLPESGSADKVVLYKAQRFPHQWVLDRTLIDGFAAVDSTLLRSENKWWLFCSSGERGFRAFNSHLYLWHADSLFGPWSPHARNPVKIDVRSARPAGQCFYHEGAWYRPAQDCSRRYGGAIKINRIDQLDEREFHETVVGTIRPPTGDYDKGIHTVSSSNGLTIVDVQRTVFEPRSLISATWAMAQGAARKAGVSEPALTRLKRWLKGSRPS